MLRIDAKGTGMQETRRGKGGLGQAGGCACCSPAPLHPCTGCPPPCCNRGEEQVVALRSAAQQIGACCSAAAACHKAPRLPARRCRRPATAHPLLSTAFCAYSVWNTRPSGLYEVTLWSYCRTEGERRGSDQPGPTQAGLLVGGQGGGTPDTCETRNVRAVGRRLYALPDWLRCGHLWPHSHHC